MSRFFLALVLFSSCAFSQSLSVGVLAGVPISDAFSSATSGNVSVADASQRLAIGPTLELRLPFGLGVSVDALYRRIGYDANVGQGLSVSHGNSFQFPIMAKYRLPGIVMRPFVGGGVAFQTTTGFKSFDGRTGLVLGGGLDFKLTRFHITPELRYTRWGTDNLVEYFNVLRPTQNQADFLVGFTF
jgi:hypothetical protein